MKFMVITLVVACIAVVVYATTSCTDILNALSLVKASALNEDSCTVSTSCSGCVAQQIIVCTYSSPITVPAKRKQLKFNRTRDETIECFLISYFADSKCQAVKAAVQAATVTLADCTYTFTTYSSSNQMKSVIKCELQQNLVIHCIIKSFFFFYYFRPTQRSRCIRFRFKPIVVSWRNCGRCFPCFLEINII